MASFYSAKEHTWTNTSDWYIVNTSFTGKSRFLTQLIRAFRPGDGSLLQPLGEGLLEARLEHDWVHAGVLLYDEAPRPGDTHNFVGCQQRKLVLCL